MIPKSVSATALTVAHDCMSRYKAEYIDRARNLDSDAALLGTTLHSALELYVNQVYVERTQKRSAKMLVDYFELYFNSNFPDGNDAGFEAGKEMCKNWSAREVEHFEGRTVLTLELKEQLKLETSIGVLGMTYILDRFDRLDNEPGVYEIMDYKSSFFNEKPHKMKTYFQPKIYAIAMFTRYPDAEIMRVTFDMLRYEHCTIEITKQEARDYFVEIFELVEKIIETPEDGAKETLNTHCNFCVRKTQCKTLNANIDVGGLFSLDVQGQIDKITEIEMKVSGLNGLKKELTRVVEESLGREQTVEVTTGRSTARFFTQKERNIESIPKAREIAGEEIFSDYSTVKITLKEYANMIKDERVTPDQAEALKALISHGHSEPSLRFENLRTDEANAVLAPPTVGVLKPAAPLAPIPGLDE